MHCGVGGNPWLARSERLAASSGVSLFTGGSLGIRIGGYPRARGDSILGGVWVSDGEGWGSLFPDGHSAAPPPHRTEGISYPFVSMMRQISETRPVQNLHKHITSCVRDLAQLKREPGRSRVARNRAGNPGAKEQSKCAQCFSFVGIAGAAICSSPRNLVTSLDRESGGIFLQMCGYKSYLFSADSPLTSMRRLLFN